MHTDDLTNVLEINLQEPNEQISGYLGVSESDGTQRGRRGILKGIRGNILGDECVHYFDCGDTSVGILCVSYFLIKLLQKKKMCWNSYPDVEITPRTRLHTVLKLVLLLLVISFSF